MKQTLQNHLANGKTEEVLTQLRQLTASDKDLHQQVLLTATRFAEYEKQKHSNIVGYDPLSIERNKINVALLAIIDKLPDTGKSSGNFESSPNLGNKTIIQNADKIYNIDHIDNANFS